MPFKGFVAEMNFYIFSLWRYYLNEHHQILYVDIQCYGEYQPLSRMPTVPVAVH